VVVAQVTSLLFDMDQIKKVSNLIAASAG